MPNKEFEGNQQDQQDILKHDANSIQPNHQITSNNSRCDVQLNEACCLLLGRASMQVMIHCPCTVIDPDDEMSLWASQ